MKSRSRKSGASTVSHPSTGRSNNNLTLRRVCRSALISSLLVTHTQATVLSTELRDLADTQLLFWSSLDCAIDAALHFFGPIDELLRFPQEAALRGSSSGTAGSVAWEGFPLWQDTRELLDNFVKVLAGPEPNLEADLPFSPDGSSSQRTAPHPTNPGTGTNLCDRNDAHNNACDETQNHNHSSLQIRGGGSSNFRLGRHKLEFSLFQEGDGSREDPDGIPKRFLDMHGGDREKARESLARTLEWREKEGIDTTLGRPHPKFALCKEVFPTSFLGRDPEGHVIFLQRPALMDVALAKQNKIDQNDVLEHYIYINEYLWQIVEGDNPLGTMVSVLDLTGLDMKVLRNREYMSFLKLFISVMDSHYPQRAHKTLVINSPKWVGTLFRLVKPFLREETTKRIEIYSHGKKQDQALKRVLGQKVASTLPESFWSKKGGHRRKRKHDEADEEKEEGDESHDEPKQFPESDLDAKLLAHTNSRNGAAGQKMQDIAFC